MATGVQEAQVPFKQHHQLTEARRRLVPSNRVVFGREVGEPSDPQFGGSDGLIVGGGRMRLAHGVAWLPARLCETPEYAPIRDQVR